MSSLPTRELQQAMEKTKQLFNTSTLGKRHVQELWNIVIGPLSPDPTKVAQSIHSFLENHPCIDLGMKFNDSLKQECTVLECLCNMTKNGGISIWKDHETDLISVLKRFYQMNNHTTTYKLLQILIMHNLTEAFHFALQYKNNWYTTIPQYSLVMIAVRCGSIISLMELSNQIWLGGFNPTYNFEHDYSKMICNEAVVTKTEEDKIIIKEFLDVILTVQWPAAKKFWFAIMKTEIFPNWPVELIGLVAIYFAGMKE